MAVLAVAVFEQTGTASGQESQLMSGQCVGIPSQEQACGKSPKLSTFQSHMTRGGSEQTRHPSGKKSVRHRAEIVVWDRA